MACTVLVGPTWTDLPREPFFVLDDAAALALHQSGGAQLVTAIHPVGTDAVFNRLQVPLLLSEIRALADRTADEDVRDQLLGLIAFVDPLAHVAGDAYVAFLAD